MLVTHDGTDATGENARLLAFAVRRFFFAAVVLLVVAVIDYGIYRALRPEFYPGESQIGGLADDTIVILTTDHGLAFPGAKATLTDRGLGVMLIVRGPGGFHGGKVSEALVSQIDLFPTLCELTGIPRPDWLQGRSLLPLVRRETDEVNDAIFAELTFHAAYEPQRAIRTQRHKYIRRFGDRLTPVLPNVDDGPTKELLIASGWADRPLPREELHDLLFDPAEAANMADDPAYSEVRAELAGRLEAWMRETADPLLEGDVEPPPGAEVTDPDQLSPAGAPVAHR